MKNLFLSTILLALVALTGQAKEKTIVWEQPTTEYGNTYGDGFFHMVLDLTKVELKADETVVYITVLSRSDYPDYWFRFASDTYLKVGEKRFTVVKADGIELDKQLQTGKDGKTDVAFHFPPLPKGTKVFDFIEGDGQGAFQILGIKPVEERWKQMLPSYWRDEQGDWKIAFLDDCAIYDCQFWNYKQRDVNPKTGEAQMVLTNGNKELKVAIGKNKNGMRAMQIGDQKVNYTMITSRFVADYPTKDTRSSFVDTGYKEDTITVVGWIKDMPEPYKQLKTFTFGYWNLFTESEKTIYADLDSLGRFTVKFPVVNSSEFFCDWRRCFVRTMLEPGKTYFLLYDYKEGRRMFMGDDCRLQNELFKYPLDWKSMRLDKEGEDFDKYLASADSLVKAQYAYIDALCQEHPTLSTRFEKFRKGNTLWQQAEDFGQSRFYAPQRKFPANASQYAYDTFWSKMEEPITLHRGLSRFLRDYLDDCVRSYPSSFETFSKRLQEHIEDLASNDEELAVLSNWKKLYTDATAKVEAAPTPEEKQKVAEELNAKYADVMEKVNKIMQGEYATRVMTSKGLMDDLKDHSQMLDSLNANQLVKDIFLSRKVYSQIDHSRTSVLPQVIDTLKLYVKSPVCLAMVEEMNNRYLAIENREFDKLVLKSSSDLANISEGEALLKKILEPYKGKFVLLDIWGTWCAPCKEALSHSTEEYARLKDYDIEFLYLANQSPQTAWENVIKEYNVSGDNVAHYNLPPEQQAAIERHLNVTGFPTYKLFDRDGNLLDLKVDARDIENLARLLEQMK